MCIRDRFLIIERPDSKELEFFKTFNFSGVTHMCQFNYLTPNIASKNNSCNIGLCVGEVLLKQWKQGNT